MQTQEQNTWLKYMKQLNAGDIHFTEHEIETIIDSATNDLNSVLGYDNSQLFNELLTLVKSRAKR